MQFGPFLGAIIIALYVTSTQRPVAEDEAEIQALGEDHKISEIKAELGLQRSEAINSQWMGAFMHFPYVQPAR